MQFMMATRYFTSKAASQALGGLRQPRKLSPPLTQFMGVAEAPRTEVVRKVGKKVAIIVICVHIIFFCVSRDI